MKLSELIDRWEAIPRGPIHDPAHVKIGEQLWKALFDIGPVIHNGRVYEEREAWPHCIDPTQLPNSNDFEIEPEGI